ncbi:hypothetical protein C6576_12525 [Mammaliicoccus sciuri]|nr:hypothetical protein C6576_12525 [Mammaliicoccus sciuri]
MLLVERDKQCWEAECCKWELTSNVGGQMLQVERDKQCWEVECCKWSVISNVGRLNVASGA